jgi:uncharacterized coiled-coil protein SlyX
MEEQKTIEQLIELVAQQQKVIESSNKYIGDVNVYVSMQKEYIDALEAQVKYYKLLKLSLWN